MRAWARVALFFALLAASMLFFPLMALGLPAS
jgi:hypothetical protein